MSISLLLAVAAALLSSVGIVSLLTTLRGLPHFASPPNVQNRVERSISVISPACNEAETVVSAVRSMLAGGDEVIVVDDRSSDRTGEILDELARDEEHLRVIHITELPAGWLGKLNALRAGACAATGDWLLFADADAHLSPDTLDRAITYMEAEGIDFLSLVPRIEPAGFWGDTVFALALALLSLGTKVWAIRDPNANAFGASGAFMMVRRKAFERTPGFEWLRMEVADDFGLSLLLKNHGGRCALLNGADTMSIKWYSSFAEMTQRMQKNFFAILGRCQPIRCYLIGAATALIALSPLGLLLGGPTAAVIAVGTVSLILASVLCTIRFKRPIVPGLFPHLGALLMAFMVIRAGWIGSRIGGIEWRGVCYSSREINEGRRVFL